MRIEFVQSGGVAFFNLAPVSLPGPRRDSFSYRITVEAEGQRHTIHTHPGAASPALDALIEQLRQAGFTLKNSQNAST